MRKNKKISTENLYIGRVVRYGIDHKEYYGNIVNTWYSFENFNPPLYTIVRKGFYGHCTDIFNNTSYKISTSSRRDGELVVVLERPIITNNDKIRYKDAEEILEKYKEKVKTKN